MCFIIQEDSSEQVAKTPIKVFKVLLTKYSKEEISSPLYKLVYKEGVVTTSELSIEKHKISSGLHSFSTEEAARDFAKFCRTMYKPKGWVGAENRIAIFDAEIPAGAKFYHNTTFSEYVSDKLMVEGIFIMTATVE